MIEIIEVFARIPLVAMAEIVESYVCPEEPQFEMSRMLSLQQYAINLMQEHENQEPHYGDAIYNLAREHYHNEKDMQTNVDPLELPFDISVADGGVWAAAWVWLPDAMVDSEIQRLEQEKTES